MLIFFHIPLGILIGCDTSNGVDVLQRAACLLVSPVEVWGFAILFGCPPVDRALGFVVVPTWGLVCWWDGGGLVLWLLSGQPGFVSWISFALVICLSNYLCFVSFLYLDLCSGG